MRILRYVLVLSCCWIPFRVIPQQYNFRHFTTKNGLSNPFVNHIYCDNRGFMWMSTQGGLSKFDGNAFINYTRREGLPSSDILCTTEDQNGNLWIGTNGSGAAVFDGSSFKTYNSKNGFIDDAVYSICCDSKGIVWLVSPNKGLYSFDGEKFKKYTEKDGLPGLGFYSACEDKQGNMWFGSKESGPVKFDRKKFSFISPEDSPLGKLTVFSIYCADDGKIWCGTPGTGLWIQEKNGFYHLEDERISTEFISSIRQDQHHNLWIATDNQLVKINGSKKQYFTIDNGLTSNTIYSLGFDKDGRLWIGTINGVNVFINEAFTGYNEKNGLTNINVTVFCHNTENELLIGTAGNGLFSYINGEITPIDIEILNHNNILCIHKAASGEIYVGLNNSEQGIVVIKKEKDKWIVTNNIKQLGGKAFATIAGFVEFKNGDMLIASFGDGLWILHPSGEMTRLATDPKVGKNVMAVLEDSKHNVWASFNMHGVVKFTNGKATYYTTKNGLGDNTVLSLCEDQHGNIVFGNNENGITIYNGKRFVTYNKDHHLVSNTVQAVTADKRGNLWVGTNNGLNKLRLDGNMKITLLKLYNESNGLLGTEINQNGIYADKNNFLWIGSNLGLTRYTPNLDYRNINPPNVVLNNIKLNFADPHWKKMGIKVDKKTKLPENPVLAYNNNHLTFYFQALTLDRVEFSYMLEGLDDEWTPMGIKNEADYTNIPPGEYVFKVQAVNSDGIKSRQELNFRFTISPPFWQTWWFRITAGVVIISLVVFIIRRRTAQLAREKKILEDKVAERTSELSIANSHLSVALEDIKDSIHYAQKIQQSILPNDHEFETVMNDSFVLFKPKDIVSGDFYWLTEKNNTVIYATCDCTGHGVPGGFMTMLGTSFLNEIVGEQKADEPGKILDQMRERIIDALKQTGAAGENKDGMDMVMCMIDKTSLTLHYAAANNGFYLVRNNELLEMKADKQPIGYFVNQQPFKTGSFQLQKGDVIYTFTDGYADQFGGPSGKKFKYKQLEQLLLQIHKEPMVQQKQKLDKAITDWMEDFEQIDDILLIGYRVV